MRTERENEHRLRQRLIAGDAEALAEAYRAYSPMVFGLLTRMLTDPPAAEDITQEVFVRLWERPERFDPERGRLGTWLCTMARSRAIDSIRRTQTRERAAVAQAQQVHPESDTADLVAHNAMVHTVRVAVQRLPEAQRIAVTLAYYEGLTYRRVAEKLGIPEGTVKSRLRFGLRGIADHLEKEGVLG
ncbi:RNA polymerase sigma factor [Amycolatopsis acidicola]|uniref:RNA polymerase sigma factor n=1 Tax=Amycolatopsis acidicola TaxID=2596893 RepID=UPI001FB5B412|nr:sigma-70 family RNA polymerase sigma factor [Amycolatopsis acidicola]